MGVKAPVHGEPLLTLLFVLVSVVFLDILLSGDNAIVIGMAANALPENQRSKAILYGMALAALARIAFSLFAIALLHHRLISIIGGISLFWVAYKLAKDILIDEADGDEPKQGKSLWSTVGLITVADISMSLDNVLAVAGIARNNPFIMVIGLIISIACLGYAAKLVTGLLDRFPWLRWLGVGLIVLIAVELVLGIQAI